MDWIYTDKYQMVGQIEETARGAPFFRCQNLKNCKFWRCFVDYDALKGYDNREINLCLYFKLRLKSRYEFLRNSRYVPLELDMC